jgi:hypothetical protein
VFPEEGVPEEEGLSDGGLPEEGVLGGWPIISLRCASRHQGAEIVTRSLARLTTACTRLETCLGFYQNSPVR